ncbi:MAG TPA: hypothetical protein DDW52_30425 [Planctomycetaceae bacterium]|nr:hypothetical protein [Planctomycetaceae bacterium]
MSQYVGSGIKTYTADAAIEQYLRVTYAASGNVELADATTPELGCAERPTFEQGEDIPVRLRSAEGTCIMVADGAIALGGDVYAGADGKCSAAGTVLLGSAESAVSADGDYIEVLRS